MKPRRSGNCVPTRFVPRTPEWHFHQRAKRQAARLGYKGWPIRVDQIANRDHLFHCWRTLAREGGRGPGIDDYTYADFSPVEVGFIVGDLSAQVLSGAYVAEPTRVVPVPKHHDSAETRKLKIGTLCDRVVGKALHEAFRPFWEKRFSPVSYGCRPRRSTWTLLADLEVAMLHTGRTVLAVDDVRNAFDNLPIGPILDIHRDALHRVRQKNFGMADKARALDLITAVLRGHDRTRERGVDQGGPYSPDALNVLMNHAHDRVVGEICEEPLGYRYVDNLVYLCRSVSEGEQVLGTVRRLLEPLGLTLKGQDGTRDLTRDEASLLGFSVRWDGQALRLTLPEDTFDLLRLHLCETHVTPNPPQAARVTVQGWVTAYAPAFEDGDVSTILTTLVACGFRESASRAEVIQWWEDGWLRWQRQRERSRRQHRRQPPR
jgi:RNA-directed DNA polymerase